MNKIPTLFVRDPDNPRYVTRRVHEACGWVVDGEGVPTRKWDGTCVMLDAQRRWWSRRTVRPGRDAPDWFVEEEHDERTGKTFGWEPAGQSPFSVFLDEAVAGLDNLAPGTYELIGPKINGNPEGWPAHAVVRHGTVDSAFAHAGVVTDGVPRDWDGLAVWLDTHDFEGVVWHHPDGRMAKIKRRDFPPPDDDRENG